MCQATLAHIAKLIVQPSQRDVTDLEDDVIDVLVNRYLGHLSGLKLLSGSFAILCILSVLLTSLLLIDAASGVVERILQKTANQAQQATQTELEHFLKAPDLLLRYVHDAIDDGYVDPNNVESLQSLLWNTPGRGDLIAFSSIYYATPEGELIGLGSRNLDWPLLDWTFSLSTAETDGKYTIVDPTREGTLSDRRLQLGDFDARQRPWFKAASLSAGPAVWSDLYADFESGKLSLSRAQANLDNNGQIRGVAGVDMHVQHIQNFLSAMRLSANGEMFIIDADGLLVAASAPLSEKYSSSQGKLLQDSQLRFSSLAAQELIEDLGSLSRVDNAYRRHLSLDGEKGLLYVAPIGHERGLKWSLGIFLPESDYLGSITALAMRVIPMMILVIITGCAIVTGFLYLVVKPVKQLADSALRISQGDFEVHVDTRNRNEIGGLARAIDHMRHHLKRSFCELNKQKQLAQTTLNSIADGVLAIDAQRVITYVNPVACQLLDVQLHDVVGKSIGTVLHAHDFTTREPLPAEYFVDALIATKNFSKELLLADSHGQFHPVYCRLSFITSESDERIGAVATFSNLTEEQRLKSELVHQANNDDLTQLSNRRWFKRCLEKAIESIRHTSDTHALCYIDLDQFKVVNDTSGHGAGDEMLRQIASLLQQSLGQNDSIARLGGDEFGVLLERSTLHVAELTIEQMRNDIANFRFFWEEHSYTISMSAGLVLIDESTISVMTALRDADNACYIAKDSGRNRIHVAHPESQALAKRREQIQSLGLIDRALEQNHFVLYMQHIEPTAPANTNASLHVEVLLRMRSESGEILSPESFLPAAEQYGLCSRIDRWVVRNTLQSISRFSHLNALPCLYSINLSGQSLGEHDFLEFMLDELSQFVVPNHWLCFEITETAAIADMGSALTLMHALRKQGCQLALDDFGSGLSSLAYLKNLPVDFLKIDGQFIRDMLDDPLHLAMVRSINDIGQTMGMKTIAEFVEDTSARQQLQLMGVDFVQGYLFGEPRPLHELHSIRPDVRTLADKQKSTT